MKVWRPQTAYALKQTPAWAELLAEIAACQTVEAVWTWWRDYLVNRHRDFPEGWSLLLRERCEGREDDLLGGEGHDALDNEYRNIMGGRA